MQLVDEILAPYASNAEVAGYKNHVCRVIRFCEALHGLDADERHKVTIAACFHDLGIYTDNTFDYLPPSVALARSYLRDKGLSEWETSVVSMIDQHHCLRSIESDGLVEVFRKADLIDFSLGLIRFDLPRSTVSQIRDHFPNSGFHRNLARVACGWIVRHPLRPVPVLRW